MSEPSRPISTDRHTPGPWSWAQVWRGPETKIHAEFEGRRVALAEVFTMYSHGEKEANARLIAAAPELLALAKQYLSECSECNGSGTTWDRDNCTHTVDCPDCADIRAVIAKAEGKAHV